MCNLIRVRLSFAMVLLKSSNVIVFKCTSYIRCTDRKQSSKYVDTLKKRHSFLNRYIIVNQSERKSNDEPRTVGHYVLNGLLWLRNRVGNANAAVALHVTNCVTFTSRFGIRKRNPPCYVKRRRFLAISSAYISAAFSNFCIRNGASTC